MSDVDELRVKITADVSGIKAGLEQVRQDLSGVEGSVERMEESVQGATGSFSGLTAILGTINPQVKKMERVWKTSMKSMEGATEGVSLAVAAMGAASVLAIGSACASMLSKLWDFWAECVELADPKGYSEASEKLDKAVEELKTTIGTLTSGIMMTVLNAITKVIGGINAALQAIVRFLQWLHVLAKDTEEELDEVQETMAGLAGFDKLNTLNISADDDDLEEAVEATEEVEHGLDNLHVDWGGLWDGFTDWCGDVADGIGGLWGGFCEWGGDAWGKITKWGGDTWAKITDKCGGLWSGFCEWGGDAWDSITTWAGNTWGTITEEVGGLWDGFCEWGGDAWDSICEWGGGVWDTLTEWGGGLWSSFSDAAGGVWNWIKEKGGSVIDSITDFFWDCVSWIYSGLATVYNWLVDVYNTLAKALNKCLGWLGVDIGYIDHVDTNFQRPGSSSSSSAVSDIADNVTDNMIAAAATTVNYAAENGLDFGTAVDSAVNWSQNAYAAITDAYNQGAIDDDMAEAYLYDMEEAFYDKLRDIVESLGAASGDVVAPGDYQLRMVGDNLRETEVISPLSTMREAFLAAIEEAGLGNGNGGSTTVELTIDGKKLARAIYEPMRAESRRRGAGAWRRGASSRYSTTAGTRAWPTRSTSPTSSRARRSATPSATRSATWSSPGSRSRSPSASPGSGSRPRRRTRSWT